MVLVIDATATDADGNTASTSVAVTVIVPGEPAESGFTSRFREWSTSQ